jgi:hypothetical protein
MNSIFSKKLTRLILNASLVFPNQGGKNRLMGNL